MERMDKNSPELMDDPFLLASWIAKSMAGELSDEELQLLDEANGFRAKPSVV